MQWNFGPFRLDLTNACLWRAEQQIPLRPKTLALLAYLVTHAGQLVTKEALFEAVWPGTAVSEGVLKTSLGELRQALGEAAKAPQWIATMRGRGYRFIAAVTQVPPPDIDRPARPLPALTAARPLVGRQAELARLHAALALARQGQRQLVWVTGEAGIGKTAMVETFVAQVMGESGMWLAQGQCVEQYGTVEAYLPILEALGQLCRAPQGARLATIMRQQAPTWLVQMPWLLTAEDRQRLRHELQGATRERMLREFAELIDVVTAEVTLLLVLEDVHWSDYATLDLIGLLARRRTPARFLLLGTFRPAAGQASGQPLPTLVQEGQRHGYGTVLPLRLLDAAAVARYLDQRFPGHQFPPALVTWLYHRTEGQPLFLVTLVQALLSQGVVEMAANGWKVHGGSEALEAVSLPEDVQKMLALQMERLPLEAQQVVAVASVAGTAFSAALVAAGLETAVEAAEEHCDYLVTQQFLRSAGEAVWPDGTVASRYEFTHGLYQQVVYTRLGVAQRMRLHQRLGVRLEAAYGARAGDIAAELAVHFQQGQEIRRAILYLQRAAENAVQRFAPREAITPLQQALALLQTLPETPERLRQELDLHHALGRLMVTTRGMAAPEAAQSYTRARALCQQLGDTLPLFPILRALGLFYAGRGELAMARELGDHLLTLTHSQADPVLLLEAHCARGDPLFYLGEIQQARTHMEQALASYTPRQPHAPPGLSGQDPRVKCLYALARSLTLLGYPEQGRQRLDEALTLAHQLVHPFVVASVLNTAATVHYIQRDAPRFSERVAALLAVSRQHGFTLYEAAGLCFQGWERLMAGEVEGSLAQIQQGLMGWQASGTVLGTPGFLSILAEGYGQAGQAPEGLRVVDEALALVDTHGERWWLAELYRLKGVLLLQAPPAPRWHAAAACFQQALAVAQAQHARWLELRTTISLARLWQQQGKQAAARVLLAPVYGWFTEGFDTADLQDARALLETLK